MKLDRRSFLKTASVAAAGITALPSAAGKAGPTNILSENRMGVLVDTTTCIGCRRCEFACKTAHDLPTPHVESYSDRTVFKKQRRPDITALTVVNEFENPKKPSLPTDVKVQCMHCDHPACVSACIVGAFSKRENGTVVWDSDLCIGCRYCMVACPFQIPAFEFEKALGPNIMKCDFCIKRTEKGHLPACVDICPVEALTYGQRSEILRLAHSRVKLNPERYDKHIYGEFEVGGTSWMYLANQSAYKFGFPHLKEKPAPGVSESIQHGIFAYFMPPLALYSLLGGIMWIAKNRQHAEED
jgi:formate dehydrogenase iron-sulfur subunit